MPGHIQHHPTPFAALILLALSLALPGELARADKKKDDVVEGKAEVVNPGVIEVDGRKFKLFGIRNPASGQACVRDAKPWNCAEAARTALRRYVDGRRVRCQPRENDKREARCWRDDQDLAELLVREGWARADRDASDDKYVDEEKEAKRARRGIWATAEENPEEVRRQQQRNY